MSFCALLDGVCLSRNKRITYLLTYLLTKVARVIVKSTSSDKFKLLDFFINCRKLDYVHVVHIQLHVHAI